MRAVQSQLCELKQLYYTQQQAFESYLLIVDDESARNLGDPWCTLLAGRSLYAICHASDFRYQALPLFSMQHQKAGKGLGTRLTRFPFANKRALG